MTEAEIRSALKYGREQRPVEFKAPGARSNSRFEAKVIRAVLGMANLADGGTVLVGIQEEDKGLVAKGLSPDDAATWQYDHFADKVAVFADPFVEFEMSFVSVDGAQLLSIDVEEFEEIPVLCRRDYADILQEGALYIRSLRKPETVAVRSHADMRAVLELAVNKGVRRLVRRGRDAGLGSLGVSDEELFARELADL